LALFDAHDKSRLSRKNALSCYFVYIYVYFSLDKRFSGIIL
jgi:hypothetical protein